MREEAIEAAALGLLRGVSFPAHSERCLLGLLEEQHAGWIRRKATNQHHVVMTLGQVAARLARATDAFLEGHIDQGLFHERRSALLEEQALLENARRDLLEESPDQGTDHAAEYLSLVRQPALLYERADGAHKRRLIQILVTDLKSHGRAVSGAASFPFSFLSSEELKPTGPILASHDLFPTLGMEDRKAGEEMLKRYLEIAWHIYDERRPSYVTSLWRRPEDSVSASESSSPDWGFVSRET